VSDAEHPAGLGAGRQDSLGASRSQCQRLLAKHLLASGEAGDRHFLMQQMRRHHRDGIDIRSRQQYLIVVGEIKFVRCREGGRHLSVDVAAGHHFKARAFRQTRDDLLAPPAEPDNADADHVVPLNGGGPTMRGRLQMRNGAARPRHTCNCHVGSLTLVK
jgi:hypothetical protein